MLSIRTGSPASAVCSSGQDKRHIGDSLEQVYRDDSDPGTSGITEKDSEYWDLQLKSPPPRGKDWLTGNLSMWINI